MKQYCIITFLLLFSLVGCHSQTTETPAAITADPKEMAESENTILPFDTAFNTIHIYVALCDNKYQGIVPVPAKIGNGQDPHNNLYWGCAYGIRTYFKNSKDWQLVKTVKSDSVLLERVVFKHISKNYYLVADAYDGKYIKQCTHDFLNSSCGNLKETLLVDEKTIGIGGNASLVAYIGHDGLMEFELTEKYQNIDSRQRDVIILACYSKHYFSSHLRSANVNPLVWTTGLMSPEAYTIHDAITGYINNETKEEIRTRAAKAYNTYQKCGEKGARNLLVTGW